MKAITIHQPYAGYLADNLKKYETRSWSTNHRGLIAIHAGKTWNADLRQENQSQSMKFFDLPDYGETPDGLGCVLAIALMEGCLSSESLRPTLSQMELAVGNFANGRYGWRMKKIIERFDTPIPAKGQQGLWDWDFPDEMLSKRVAIVGSREYGDLDAVKRYVQSLPLDTVIISGGAEGVDLCAETTARERGMRVISIPVDTYNLPKHYEQRKQEYGRRAKIRNQYIVEMAGSVVAFWNNKSTGTKDSIDKAERIGRPVTINPTEHKTPTQMSLTGFLDTYDESAYIEKAKTKQESSPDLKLYKWEKPWLITDDYVWSWDWKDGNRDYFPVGIRSEKAKRQQRNLSGFFYASETMHLRHWLEQQQGWQDVPYEVIDIGDMASGYLLRSGSTTQRIPLNKVVFVQDQYNVHIAMTYFRTLKLTDEDGNLPYLAKFADSDTYYVFDGTHRTLAYIWAGREFIHADVCEYGETFEEACGLEEDDTEFVELCLEVLKEAYEILEGDKQYA